MKNLLKLKDSSVKLDAYENVQSIAKKVHDRLHGYIDASSTEESIVKKSIEILSDYGISETWYHNVPAFVLLGSRSCLSISGREYSPTDEKVGEINLVTVDLSPSLNGIWGDCARSYYIEDGRCTDKPQCVEFQEGKSAEAELHCKIKEFVTPKTMFSELYEFGNHEIKELGFENLDFLDNLGHSIETKTSARRFIDKYCHEKLRNVQLFTFEPHIRKVGGAWGFKHENIYYFTQSGQVQEL